LTKKLTSLICLYGILLGLLNPVVLLAQEGGFQGFFEDPSLLGTDNIYQNTETENNAEEEELALQLMLELMDMQSSLCRDTNGKFKIGEVVNPLGDEPIDCTAFTLLQYQLIETENNADMAFKCISIGRKPIQALGLLRTLGIEAEKHFNCPGKDQEMSACMDDLVCNTLKSSPIGLAAKALEYVGVPKMKCDTTTDSNCLTEAFWGIWKNLVTNVDAAWMLLKLGWKGVKWAGNKLKDGAKAVGRMLCFWCETNEIEDQVEMSQHMIMQQKDGFFTKFLKSPLAATKDLLGKLFSSFKQYIGESIGNNFGCTKWSSNRFNPISKEEAYCEDPVLSWDCATCSQKMNMACGVVGFIGGEILTSFIAGKALAYGAKMSQFTKLNVISSKVTTGIGKTKLASGITKGGKFVGSKITGVLSLGKTAAMGIVKSAGQWAIKIGGKVIPLSATAKRKLLKILAGAGKYGKMPFTAIGKGGKRYLELLEESFVLGYQGKHGLKALKTSRQISKIEKQLKVMRSAVNAQDLGRTKFLQEQMAALESLKEYREILRIAVASKGDKMSHVSKMRSKLSEYIKRKHQADKHAIALRATSRTSEVKRFLPSAQEKAYEAVLIKDGVSAKFIKNVATKSEVRKIMSANRERLFEATQIAGRKLTKVERHAILKAHYTGTRNTAGSFSKADITKKLAILRDAGLKDISRALMQSNVTGMDTLYAVLINANDAILIIKINGAAIGGTSYIILESIIEKLKHNDVKYVGNGRFVNNKDEEETVLLLDQDKDKALIQNLDKKLNEINGNIL
jgi:hypothetical protein